MKYDEIAEAIKNKRLDAEAGAGGVEEARGAAVSAGWAGWGHAGSGVVAVRADGAQVAGIVAF